jgi:Protein of unknown function (DUF2934)
MSLIHYVRPFLELGICKEYTMARKTTGNGIANRSKKSGGSTSPAAVQVAEVREIGRPAKQVHVERPVNLEEEIRRRAYELYLQRAATAGNGNGDQNQDWLIAEREIRSRHGSQERHTA